jgi:hypothetical protein
MTIVNDATSLRVTIELSITLLDSSIVLLESSIKLLELSIMLLENIYSTGVTQDDCPMMTAKCLLYKPQKSIMIKYSLFKWFFEIFSPGACTLKLFKALIFSFS